MSVIISDSTNPSYDGNLSTANGFYRVEAHNLGSDATSASFPLTTARALAVTFANSGNCKGVVLSLLSLDVINSRDANVRLQESITVGSFDTSTEKVNINTHGLANGTVVSFTSTGTLPTGITANTVYYVINAGTNDFQISTTAGGSVVALSGTPTGTATCWATRATSTLSATNIFGTTTGTGSDRHYSQAYAPFVFSSPYAVDTTAGKWRFHLFQSGGTAGTFYPLCSDATNFFYATWCDTQISHADNDTMIVMDSVTINKTATIAAVLPTGVTTQGVCGVICRNTDYSEDNVALLKWENPASSSYTFTIKGALMMGTHSGFRVGTATNPIAYAQKADIYFDQANVGTVTTSSIKSAVGSYITSYPSSKCSLFFYGEVPSLRKTTLASDAATGQKVIVTIDDTSAQWAANDYVIVGKCNTKGVGSTTVHQINSISGTSITLKENLDTALRKAGGTVYKSNGYGVVLRGYSNAVYGYIYCLAPSRLTAIGCDAIDFRFTCQASSYYYYPDGAAYRSQHVFKDSIVRFTALTISTYNQSHFVGIEGVLFDGIYTFRGTVAASLTGYSSNLIKSGLVEVKNCIQIGIYTSSIFPTASTRTYFHDNILENAYYHGVYLNGLNVRCEDNYFWGTGSAYLSYGALAIGQIVNGTIARNTYEYNGTAIGLISGFLTSNVIDTDSVFISNTYDVGIYASAIVDYEMKNPTGIATVGDTQLADTILGSRFRITNYNGTANDIRNWLTNGYIVTSGDGLADTTVRTSGTGKYAMRFEPGFDTLEWEQVIPTGNIQNKTMFVSVWVKINSANYYSATYTLPTLTVDYDDGTTSTATASANTDWQRLSVVVTPTTTYGVIKVKISGYTDQTGTNARFYVDDFSIAYPAGYQLDLGGVDVWYDGLPVNPTISIFPSLGGVWDEPLASHDTFGTYGNQVKKALTVAKYIGYNSIWDRNKAISPTVEIVTPVGENIVFDGENVIYDGEQVKEPT
jgi:hypothetical protein